MWFYLFGVLIASNKEKIEELSDKVRDVPAVGGATCIIFMALTQLPMVKALLFLVSNAVSLLTCIPKTIGIILLENLFDALFINCMLMEMWKISY